NMHDCSDNTLPVGVSKKPKKTFCIFKKKITSFRQICLKTFLYWWDLTYIHLYIHLAGKEEVRDGGDNQAAGRNKQTYPPSPHPARVAWSQLLEGSFAVLQNHQCRKCQRAGWVPSRRQRAAERWA
uniref:Uncharacterized protein n=1 Tax=Cyprinodon variegatus TaxID=28743 RepID=A0A3Q2CXM1_CYPVA